MISIFRAEKDSVTNMAQFVMNDLTDSASYLVAMKKKSLSSKQRIVIGLTVALGTGLIGFAVVPVKNKIVELAPIFSETGKSPMQLAPARERSDGTTLTSYRRPQEGIVDVLVRSADRLSGNEVDEVQKPSWLVVVPGVRQAIILPIPSTVTKTPRLEVNLPDTKGAVISQKEIDKVGEFWVLRFKAESSIRAHLKVYYEVPGTVEESLVTSSSASTNSL